MAIVTLKVTWTIQDSGSLTQQQLEKDCAQGLRELCAEEVKSQKETCEETWLKDYQVEVIPQL